MYDKLWMLVPFHLTPSVKLTSNSKIIDEMNEQWGK
jgi:hypothetical protein